VQKNAQQDTDGVVWNSTGLRLGEFGMDLRRPAEPPALADLVNARFLDERTVTRRGGHGGAEIRDGSAFPTGALGAVPRLWMYGHGQVVGVTPGSPTLTGGAVSVVGTPPADSTLHHPIALHGAGTFTLNGETTVWTGDRLLAPRTDGNPAIGGSPFWQRPVNVAAGDAATAVYQRGVPAHLPLETDTAAPAFVTGDWVETCLTTSLRVYVHIAGGVVTATVINRTTGAVISTSTVNGTSTAPVEPTLVSSGGTPALLFRDKTDGNLRLVFWTGTGWTPEEVFAPSTAAYDVAVVPGGFWVAWLTVGNNVFVGRYAGTASQFSNPAFGTQLTTAATPSAPFALAVAPDSTIGIAYRVSGGGPAMDEFTPAGVATNFALPQQVSVTADTALSLVSRGLPGNNGVRATWEWVMHAGGSNGVVSVLSFGKASNATVVTSLRYNSDLISRAFRVGDEVFAWLRTQNAKTHYLLVGASHPYVAGYADREEAVTPKAAGGGSLYWPHRVLDDPSDARTWDQNGGSCTKTWVRMFNNGDTARAGNTNVGGLDFLPPLSTAVHGKSAYLSGSAVKNWDGRVLADAGYQDFPVISGFAPTTGGSLTLLGAYEYRAYVVRYNDAGERFESGALTTPLQTLVGGNNKITLTINTVPSISTDDSVIEVYRTEAGGVGFFLEGVVNNTLGAATVQFVSTMADGNLIAQKGDPHAPVVGGTPTLETFGPLGSAILVSIGDRIWSAGGQIPAGVVQFSTLKSPNFGAGYDDLGEGFLQVDNESNGITSIAGMNDATAIFEHSRIFIVGGTGPDNFGQGSFTLPQIVLAAGATTHRGTILSQLGVHYWGDPGPLLLTQNFTVQNISSPVRPLTSGLTPTAVEIDTARMEIVWYLDTTAVLFNYMAGQPGRWARWDLSASDVVSADSGVLITAAGRILTESASAYGDDSVPFSFSWRSGNVRPEQLLQGHAQIHRAGVLGIYAGPHQLRLRTYFDGSPLWSEESVWHPQSGTWLTAGTAVSGLTAGAADGQGLTEHSGTYSAHKRMRRLTCNYASFEVTDLLGSGPTYTPLELSLEIGAKPGLGRSIPGTFTGQDR
jgi:hypothetical protein